MQAVLEGQEQAALYEPLRGLLAQLSMGDHLPIRGSEHEKPSRVPFRQAHADRRGLDSGDAEQRSDDERVLMRTTTS
jgi:hypothetical protein